MSEKNTEQMNREGYVELITQLLEFEPITTHIGIIMMLSNGRGLTVLDKIGLLAQLDYKTEQAMKLMEWPDKLTEAVDRMES